MPTKRVAGITVVAASIAMVTGLFSWFGITPWDAVIWHLDIDQAVEQTVENQADLIEWIEKEKDRRVQKETAACLRVCMEEHKDWNICVPKCAKPTEVEP